MSRIGPDAGSAEGSAANPARCTASDLARLRQQLAILSELAEQRGQQARSLAGQLTLAEQRERERLAQLLHDDMQQVLVAAKYNLEAMLRKTEDREVGRRGRMIAGLLDKAVEQTRTLNWQLSPPILKSEGLASAMRWLSQDLAAKNILNVKCIADKTCNPQSEEAACLLFQIARELLLNVAKHAGVAEATVQLHRDGDTARLHVADRGRGFDTDKLKNSMPGAHFGLASIRQRVECLGGRVGIQSHPGLGTCVEVEVPAHGHNAAPPATQGERPPEAPIQRGRSRTSGSIRLLLVDDHAIVRKGLIELLKSERDIQVVGEAADGNSAVELARQRKPHVVVMDVSIPELDGLEATRQIMQAAPGVKVIGLSMHEARYMQSAMLRAGAVMYLNKAGPPTELVAAIRKLAPKSSRQRTGGPRPARQKRRTAAR